MSARKKKIKDLEMLDYIWASLRIGMGAIFLWAFADKFLGLGFSTCRHEESGMIMAGCSQSFIEGGSPTTAFLQHGTQGPLAETFQELAGNNLVDLLFMAGLLGIGLGLILGIGVKLATNAGVILLGLMYLATLWPANNPLIDDHIIYMVVLTGIYYANSRQKWGLRDWWLQQPLVKHTPILE
jgi:thiosulfate dehydrogenase (quinone) large subunit